MKIDKDNFTDIQIPNVNSNIFCQLLIAIQSIAKYALIYPCGIFSEVKLYGDSEEKPNEIAQLFIHGYGHNSTAWKSWKKEIKAKNFTNAHTINLHGMFINNLSQFSEQVKKRIADIHKETGSTTFQLIGHSMGGNIACNVAGSNGKITLKNGTKITIESVVTIASPLKGTPLSHIALDPSGRSMISSSPHLKRVRTKIKKNTSTRFLHIGSSDDLIVPSNRTRVGNSPYRELENVDHLGILHHHKAQKLTLSHLSNSYTK